VKARKVLVSCAGPNDSGVERVFVLQQHHSTQEDVRAVRHQLTALVTTSSLWMRLPASLAALRPSHKHAWPLWKAPYSTYQKREPVFRLRNGRVGVSETLRH